tara:strand:- start:28135 stop:28809 length:675 start_codon:yes stop_codon:yes gene_type:complete
MANNPLDEIAADLKVLGSPTVGANLNKNNLAFSIPEIPVAAAPSNVITKDAIYSRQTADAIATMTVVQREEYFKSLGILPPSGIIPSNPTGPFQSDAVSALLNQTTPSAETIGTNLLPTPSITMPVPLTSGATVQTSALPAAGPANAYGSHADGASPYVYQPIDLYDDRYDFLTGQKIRTGAASGIGGGAGSTSTAGNIGLPAEAQEPSANSLSTVDRATAGPR